LIIGKLSSSTHILQGAIVHQQNITNNTKVITMECDEILVRGNVEDFGKHYLVRAMSNRGV